MSAHMIVYTDDGEASRCTVVILQSHNIVFKQVDVTDDPKLLNTLNAAGHTTLPVVVVGNDVWTGYRPDKIRAFLRTPHPRVRRDRTA